MKHIKRFFVLTTLLIFTMVFIGGATANDTNDSIVDVATDNGNFTTLLAAAEASGLANMLDQNGPFTLLAPTDEAFSALPEGTVASLLEDTDTLRQILLYHVVQGRVPAADVVTLTSARTALGKNVAIKVTDEGVVINDVSNVILTDVQASNGIIHVIDSVLLPPMDWASIDQPTAPVNNKTDAVHPDKNDTPHHDHDMPNSATKKDAAQLLVNMKKTRVIIEQLGGLLDRLYNDEIQNCAEYLGYYRGLEMAPVLDGLTPQLDALQSIYLSAIAKVKETNNGIKEICSENSGLPSTLTRDVARMGINEALNMLIPSIEELELVVGDIPVPASHKPIKPTPSEDMPVKEDNAPSSDTTESAPTNSNTAVPPTPLIADMQALQTWLGAMIWELDQLNSGVDACNAYVMNYEKIKNASSMIPDAPINLSPLHAIYATAIEKALDSNLAVYETCQNAGTLTDLNYGVGRIGANEALEMLNPAIASAKEGDNSGNASASVPVMDTPAEVNPSPDDDTSIGDDPRDTDRDGEISEDEFDVALDAFVDRISMHLENGALPFKSENLYVDMIFVHTQIAFSAISLIESDDCNEYVTSIFPIFVAPTYQDVPAKWSAVYDTYREAIDVFGEAHQQAVQDCEENAQVSEDAILTAVTGGVIAQNMIEDSMIQASALLSITAPVFVKVEFDEQSTLAASANSLSLFQ